MTLEPDRPARVCVVGAGAIGGFFGARLAQGHAQVSAFARGATLQALRDRGWGLDHDGQRRYCAVQASDDAHALGPQEVVIVAVKAPALAQVAAQLGPLLAPHTIVVPAMNGVPWWFTRGLAALGRDTALRCADADGSIARAIPDASVLGAVVYPACSTPEPGVCRHHSGSRVVFGEPFGPTSPRLAAWIGLLQRAGFDAVAADDIRTEVWRKLLGNAAFNPVSLLVGETTDRLIDDPDVHALFVALMGETLAVGRAMGITPDLDPAERIALTRRLGTVKTSMLQDAEAGRRVELDALLGAVIELAERLGVDVPTSRVVWALARRRAHALGLL